MIKIPVGNKVYEVTSWRTFRAWVRRFAVCYIILAVACSLGLYQFTIYQKNQVVDNINSYATEQCMKSSKDGIKKINNIVDSLIHSRETQLKRDLKDGDTEAAADDVAAINRYKNNYFHVPSPAECEIPILEK